jgi:hypothetical protein
MGEARAVCNTGDFVLNAGFQMSGQTEEPLRYISSMQFEDENGRQGWQVSADQAYVSVAARCARL